MAGETSSQGRASNSPGVGVAQQLWDAGPSAVAAVAGVREGLAGVDVTAMTDRERVDLITELERLKGAASAAQARATHAVRVSHEGRATRDVGRSVGSMVALARRESPSLGDRFVGLSRALVTEMPGTMAALAAGVISERHAVAVVAASACLSVEDRAEVDARVSPLLGRLGVKGAAAAAGRVAAELDAAAVVARRAAAVASRRVTTRPAPDGMAYLTVLGELKDVVGAYAAVKARARAVTAGACPEEPAGGRGVGAVMADTALRALSGRAAGQLQPLEVHLVITDRALLGVGDPKRSVDEPARIPAHGSVPATVARAWLREGLDDGADSDPALAEAATAASRAGWPAVDAGARTWLRRVFTCPEGSDLVAMDSRRRTFSGLLRRMLVLRDDVCATPWCEAPIVQADHAQPAREFGVTRLGNGTGLCARCNQVKEAPGWAVRVLHDGLAPCGGPTQAGRTADAGSAGHRPREVELTTPTGHSYHSTAPPVTGWGWTPSEPGADPPTHPTKHPERLPLTASALERRLLDLLAG